MIVPSGAFGDLQTLVADFRAAWSQRFGDVAKDLVALEDVAAVLADIGVPDARLAETLLGAGALLAKLKEEAPDGDQGNYWFYRPGPRVER